jgi:DNA repair exonuclease SbcCD ATPase subunit
MTVAQAQKEVEGLESEIKKTEREIHELLESRPAAALDAQRGKPGALDKLDGEIKKARERKVVLEDALRQARWNVQRAAEGELVPVLRERIEAGRELRAAVKHLESALARERNRRETLTAKASELKLSGRLVGADPGDIVLARIAHAVGVKIERPFVHPGLAEEGRLEEIDAQLSAIITQFESKAKAPGPKLARAETKEDRPQGFLAAMGAAFRKEAESKPPRP